MPTFEDCLTCGVSKCPDCGGCMCYSCICKPGNPDDFEVEEEVPCNS